MTKLLANMTINLKVKSIGWCLQDSVGGVPGKTFPLSAESQVEKSDIFSKPFKNFGRLDNMSKAVCTAIAFSLKGSELYPLDKKQPISIFFNNPADSADSDRKYFRDFVDFDESAGRGNLFLYTLPTSPLGEASVHFGLTGDIAYFTDNKNPMKTMLEAAEDASEFRQSNAEKLFLIGLAECRQKTTEAIFILVSSTGKEVDKSAGILSEISDFNKLKEYISGEIIL